MKRSEKLKLMSAAFVAPKGKPPMSKYAQKLADERSGQSVDRLAAWLDDAHATNTAMVEAYRKAQEAKNAKGN